MTSVTELRGRMDRINNELKIVLLGRLHLVTQIMAVKQETGHPRKDMARETEIMDLVLTSDLSPFEREYLRTIFRAIFSHTDST